MNEEQTEIAREIFDMVYKWGQVNLKVESKLPEFYVKEIEKLLKTKYE